ncbi:hypothetical protein NEUTE1DRAFT_135757 [Neurospora tetrasperma FGSC 2508]|uniref:Uncharacterized protein n=1 Tax=Neurospora tetrasperma (strain FGSC 2508 / ATCC MYA-4615 / P0657) TaxID=510951 RepID=F8MGN2_NEUT8|nr:uncharacterized protein NEUTE1DRAFT_135757 [Neurospora tetrasperma FGSC 2508]EGO58654.1 hypothetical protein NEUTE1DRAFT_135757 [Neurospora tetrasperma FGSC 2508]EGZ72736.1 hypothetical protein NEUTE2DRAFT_164945 [Neurospora tetrasperma FGSC 2509]
MTSTSSPTTQPPSSSSASFASPPSVVITDKDDLPTLLIQMQETISQIHTTIITLQPPSPAPDHGAGGGNPYSIASPEERLKINDLVTRRESAIRSLLNAFTAETQFLSQKRRVEREEMLERRRAEDAELQRRRREEDELWEERLRQEDEERERTLEKERGEVERETEELMGEIEKEWERRWEEEVGRLRGLEGRRKELNRLIEEKLQVHTETPLPLNSRAIREARKASAAQMLEPEQTSQAQEEPVETHVNERGYLPAAAFENAPPDSDRYYKLPDSESEQEEEEEEEEPLAREETGSGLSQFKDKMASMSMDDLLNRPDELSVAAPVAVAASRPTSPVARTLSAAAVGMEEDMEEDVADTVSVGDLAAAEETSDEPVPGDKASDSIRERKVEIETKTTDTKTSLVDVEFRGLPFSEYTMDRNLRSAGFAEVDEEEEDVEEGEEGQHCGLPVGHHHLGSNDTAPVVVERATTEESRGRHDSLGIIHPPAAPAQDGHRARGAETDKAGRGTGSSPESETSDYTPYTQAPLGFSVSSADHQVGHGIDTDTNPPDTKAPTDHANLTPPDTGLPTHPTNPPDTAPANADSSNTDTETNRTSASNSDPTPEETSHTDLPNLDNIDTVPTLLTIPSNADVDAEADSSISTASERGSYTDINEPTSPISPTAAKAMEEDDDADFVPEQWQVGEDVQLQGMEREGEGEHVMGQGQGQGQKEGEVLMDEIEDVLDDELLEPDEQDVDHHSVERAQGCIDLAVAEIEREWEREHQGEHEQQHGGEEGQEQGVDEEAALQKKVIEKEVLQGLVDDPVGPAHDGRFELQEEATRARGVLEPYASEVDLGQGAAHDQEEAQKYEEAEGPVMGVEGVAEPCVTRVKLHPPGHGPEHEEEPEPEPVPIEELVREQEEMGLGRPEPHDSAEFEHDEGHTPVQILDTDHHPLDPSHIPFAVGVALTHSEPVQMHHTPIEEGDHEPAHYFVNQHHVPHSTDDYYTPTESPLHRSDQHQEHLNDSYAPRDHAEEQAHEEAHREREVPDVSEEVEEDFQPRYQLYERPYTPSDLAPTPGLEASFHSVEHAASMDGQPEVVVTLQPDTRVKTADDQREDRPGDDQDTEDDDDDEISHQLERVPSRQDITEEPESHGLSVDDDPDTAERQHAVQTGDMHHRDMEPGPEHHSHREDYNEDVRVQEALSSESESEDFEGRDDLVTHHLDVIAEEECDEGEAELGDGVERRDMAAEAEKQTEGHVDDDEGDAAAAALSDEHDLPVDETSNVTLFSSGIVHSVADAEAKTEGLVAPQDTVESAPDDVHGYDMEPNTRTFVREQHETEGTRGTDVDNLTEDSVYERIDEEGVETTSPEGQPAFAEARELKAAHPVMEQEHASHEHQVDEDQQAHANSDDNEYDPFRYSSPKTITEEHATPAEHPDVEGSLDKVLSVEEPTSVLSHEHAARAEKSLAEELEGVGEEEAQESDYGEEGPQREEHHTEQSPAGPVAIDDQVGHGYRLGGQETETLADDGHLHDHDNADAQPSQPCEPPVLQLTEPSDTENGEFPSETFSISYHPHAVTRGEDMGRDWSEVDQFLSESDYEDEPEQAEHVEEIGAAADAVAHAHPSVDVDIDAEVEAALETPVTEVKPADDTAELHDYHDDHVGIHHPPEPAQSQETNPESATYDDRHDHENRPSTPLDQPSQSEKPEAGDRETVTPAHPHDLPPLSIPTTPPGLAQDHVSHETQQQPKEEKELVPRDVTNRASRSDTINTAATFATADTSGTVPTASSPQSARSGTTLSSGPSSPVEGPASGQDPRIRDMDSVGDNIGRPRGGSSLTDAGTDYSGGGYGDSLAHDKEHDITNRASTPKVMEMWHQREASLSRNEDLRLSGESVRSSSQNRVTSGSGSGSTGGGGGGGGSLFQRMRSVFEQSSSSPSSASAPATSTSHNRVSMPSFFSKSHTASPSQSASVFESTVVKQRPMSTSPYPAYSSSHHRDHNGYGHPASTQSTERVEAEEAGEDRGLLHRDAADDTSSEGYDEGYERERERREERRREEWREGQHAYGEESNLPEPVYDEPELELQNRKTVVEEGEEGKGLVRVTSMKGDGKESRVKDWIRKNAENGTSKWAEIDNSRVPKEHDVGVCAHKVEVVGRGRGNERGRRWIDPRLRWNGDPQGPTKKTAVPPLYGLEVRLPPPSSSSLALPPNSLEAVNIWRQGVVKCPCPPPVLGGISSSTGIINSGLDLSVLPDLKSLPDSTSNDTSTSTNTRTNPSTNPSTSTPNPRCGKPHTDDAPNPHGHATLPPPLEAPPEVPPSNTTTNTPQQPKSANTQATQLEPVGDLRLAHFFTQGWLARLRSAQSFIDRARMEREFDDMDRV